jgi:7-carboxy-7-deazaguanine synthase
MSEEINYDFEYRIAEIFESIQGEGCWLGRPAIFIRMSGCNLQCSFCDTKTAWEPKSKGYGYTSLHDLMKRIPFPKNYSGMIVITGGEPTIQNLKPLCQAIKYEYPSSFIAIETNGTSMIGGTDSRKYIDWVTCSPKPSLFEIWCKPDELKYVVTKDFSIKSIPPKYMNSNIPIWVQPDGNDDDTIRLAKSIVYDYPRIKLGIQMQKYYKMK